MKQESKLLVHVSKSGRELDEWKASIVALNRLYKAAAAIFPSVPTDYPLSIVDAVNTFLLNSVLNKRTAPSKAAELNGFQLEYERIIKFNSELGSVFKQYSNQVEFKGGKFIEAETFKAEWDERHSIYLTKPAEIALYRQVEMVILEWQKAIRMSKLSGETHLGWRLTSAFKLVTMDGNTKPIPNYIMVKDLCRE